MMPPMIPSTKPAMKPPPMIRLKTASGKMTTLPIVPYPRIIMIEPTIMMRPMTAPIMNVMLPVAVDPEASGHEYPSILQIQKNMFAQRNDPP